MALVVEVVVASGKGGVGKSTLSSTLAIYLKEKGRDVIAIDADADAPNLHLVLEVDSWELEEPYEDAWVAEIDQSKCTACGICAEACPFGAISVINGIYSINKVICEGCLTCTLACPYRAIVRSRVRRGVIRRARTKYGFPLWTSELLPGRPNTGKLVTEVKNRARSAAGEGTVAVVDAAAGIGCQVISSLVGASVAILVAEPTAASMSDLKRVHVVAKQMMIPSALVVNKYDVNPGFVEELLKYAKEENMDVLGMIPYDDHVPRAMAQARPLIKVYPEAPASKALLEVAGKVHEILSDLRGWSSRHRPSKPAVYRPLMIKPPEL